MASIISFVHPRTSKHAATITDPIIMKGLRRPYLDMQRSDTTPTIGCIISPDSGPAIQTREVRDFERPSLRRYGVQSVSAIVRDAYIAINGNLQVISTPHVSLHHSCQIQALSM